MYPINNTYKNYIKNSLSLSTKSKIEVDGVTYTSSVIKTYPKIKHKSNSLIGTFPSKTCSFEIFDINNNIDFEGKEIKVYRGLYINGEIEWIPQGVFIPKSSNITTNISAKTVSLADVQDKTQFFDTTYKSNLSWSDGEKHTGLEIINEICINLNIELESNNFNWSTYQFKQPNFSANITYREVVSRLAEIGGCIAYINRLGKLEIKGLTDTKETIERKRYTKLSKERIVGPFNTVVLGKDGISDDIIYPDEIQGERIEWRISDNPFVDLYRKEMISEVANYIIGKSYIPFELNDFVDGFYFDLNDAITVNDKNGNSFVATILNYETSSRIKSNISADVNGKTVTNYKLAGSQKQSMEDVKLNVDHINKKVNAMSLKVDDLSDYIKTVNANDFLNLDKTMYSEAAVDKLSIKGFTIKELYPDMAYPSDYTYPGVLNFYTLLFSNEQIIYTPTLPTANSQTELYNVGGISGKFYRCVDNEWVEETNLENVKFIYINSPIPLRTLTKDGVITYDEISIENNITKIIQRISLNDNNQEYVLDTPVTYILSETKIPTFEGNTYVTLKYWTSLIYECNYMIKNEFTSRFATLREVLNQINISSEGILIESKSYTDSSMGDGDSLIASINTKSSGKVLINASKLAEIKANQINFESYDFNLTSKNMSITSDNFTLDKDGNCTANKFISNNAIINGGKLSLFDNGNLVDASIVIKNNIAGYDTMTEIGANSMMFMDNTTTNNLVIGYNIEQNSGHFIHISNESSETLIESDMVQSPNFNQISLKKYKKDFNKLSNAISIIKGTDIYKYHLKSQKTSEKKHIGLVIGDGFKYSKDILNQNETCVDLYAMVSVCFKAIQEQQEEIDKIETRISELERKLKNENKK